MLVKSTFKTPAGSLEVGHDEHYIYSATFILQPPDVVLEHVVGTMGRDIASQLSAYFSNPHYRFQLSLKPLASSFQQKVWNALLVIPVGRTMSYGELAIKLQSSPRAIGQACKTNPLALFIPCHRVVGKNDQGGYMGNIQALPIKLALLCHEALCRDACD